MILQDWASFEQRDCLEDRKWVTRQDNILGAPLRKCQSMNHFLDLTRSTLRFSRWEQLRILSAAHKFGNAEHLIALACQIPQTSPPNSQKPGLFKGGWSVAKDQIPIWGLIATKKGAPRIPFWVPDKNRNPGPQPVVGHFKGNHYQQK